MSLSFVNGERQGWLEISDVITVRIFPIWYSSPFFRSVCSVSVCMFKILVQGSCFYHWGLDVSPMSPLHWDVHSSLPHSRIYCWKQTQSERVTECITQSAHIIVFPRAVKYVSSCALPAIVIAISKCIYTRKGKQEYKNLMNIAFTPEYLNRRKSEATVSSRVITMSVKFWHSLQFVFFCSLKKSDWFLLVSNTYTLWDVGKSWTSIKCF